MPGPGGGGHSGGFGGGSRGGGFGGGSGGFGGGSRGPRGPRGRGTFYFGPRGFGYGGGCISGLLAVLLAPLIIMLVLIVIIFAMFADGCNTITGNTNEIYDEEAFQDYANKTYNEEFGSLDSYEDNILLIFLTNDDFDGYYCIAWVGDHLSSKVSDMFGDEYTDLGRSVHSRISNELYKYSLIKGLSNVVEDMDTKVLDRIGTSSAFICKEEREAYDSHVVIKADYIQASGGDLLDNALEKFTLDTGIPMVIVIDDMNNVFEKPSPLPAIICLAVVLIVIVIICISYYKKYKENKNNPKNGKNGNDNRFNTTTNRYSDNP